MTAFIVVLAVLISLGEGAGGWCPVAEGGAGGGSSQDTVSR